jgi:predicted O-linked N-acetylglucosamine transferase (SPINDLY family)
LPELITNTQQNYEARAIELATHPAKQNKIKTTLGINKLTTILVDVALFSQHI